MVCIIKATLSFINSHTIYVYFFKARFLRYLRTHTHTHTHKEKECNKVNKINYVSSSNITLSILFYSYIFKQNGLAILESSFR
jgi:hypothetical protein